MSENEVRLSCERFIAQGLCPYGGISFDTPDPPDMSHDTTGAPKFLFDEDPPLPGEGGNGPLEGNQQFASVFKASRHLQIICTATRSNQVSGVCRMPTFH